MNWNTLHYRWHSQYNSTIQNYGELRQNRAKKYFYKKTENISCSVGPRLKYISWLVINNIHSKFLDHIFDNFTGFRDVNLINQMIQIACWWHYVIAKWWKDYFNLSWNPMWNQVFLALLNGLYSKCIKLKTWYFEAYHLFLILGIVWIFVCLTVW